ncbi:hypothetical protein G7B40_027495 [Aetokthonos hydrillicola Thurmond2011]|jgi:uncharacterized protein YceK|uniref:Lipoprotein n=1 Tax=Aetokthonos hydrillicola Thurmond2011 TaxID=2712845 RepID=A0AAP5IBB1_9CYAN|nr:hypothetical protein [Aetokthonos hydrillicola]MBO3459230.1 coiled-coil domain-containing protein 22 [Aetokthonos hydrillicola CCALA 1050]MBW4584190.1 hypothetical protein [Aetokthonos hydrillicola CCALA 1050]MDR9898276.1 hypothetical protein [Aetokthonos hydrillicola Thurmond2011]
MGKRNSSRYFLIFVLGVSLLAGCKKIQQQNDGKSDNPQATTFEQVQVQDNRKLENLQKELDSNYQEVDAAVKAFSQEVTGKSRASQVGLRSSQVNKKLEELSELINKKMFTSQPPEEIKTKIGEINILIESLRQKVIKPTQKGWNKRTLLEIQRNLGQVPITESNKNLKSQIDKFLKSNLTQLDHQIKDLKLSVSQQPTNLALQPALVTSDRLHVARLGEGVVSQSASSLGNITQTRLPNNSDDKAVTLSYIAILLSGCSVVVSTYALLTRNSAKAPANRTRANRNRVTQISVNQSAESEILQDHFVTHTELEKVLAEWKRQMTHGQITENQDEHNLPRFATERNPTQISQRYRISQESPDIKKLVERYNTDPGSLSHNAIEVSAREDSITQRRLGLQQAIVLERVGRGKGNYWVLTGKDFNYLVPKKSIKINEFNYETVEALFVCNNYQPGYTHFQLCKPGKVMPISQGETWQLSEQGQLQF